MKKSANVQGNPYESNLGDTDGAMASYRKAESLLQSVAAGGAMAPMEVRLALGRVDRALGDIHEVKGNYAEMIHEYRRSLEVFARLDRDNPSNATIIDEMSRAYSTLADGLDRTEHGRAEQVRCFEQALACRQKLVEQVPGDIKYRRSLAILLMKLGGVTLQDKAHGVSDITRGVVLLQTLSTENPDNALLRRSYAVGLFNLGWAQSEVGDFEGSLANRQKVLAIREQTATADPNDEQAQFDLAASHIDLADALTSTGQPEKALDHALQSVASLEKMMAAAPGNTTYIRACGLAYKVVGNAQSALGARESFDVRTRSTCWADAKTAYQKAQNLFSDLRAKGALRSTDADVPASLTSKIVMCDERIVQLGK